MGPVFYGAAWKLLSFRRNDVLVESAGRTSSRKMAVVDMKGFCQPAQAGLALLFSFHPTCLLFLSIVTPLSLPPPNT